MTIETKFAPGDTAWFIHPFTGAVVSSPVMFIDVNVDSFSFITVRNNFTYANLQFYIKDDVAFATQAELVAAYAAQEALTDTGALIIVGIAPEVEIATP